MRVVQDKCSSCGGDYYHYAGCAIGEHGELVSGLPIKELERRNMELLKLLREHGIAIPKHLTGEK